VSDQVEEKARYLAFIPVDGDDTLHSVADFVANTDWTLDVEATREAAPAGVQVIRLEAGIACARTLPEHTIDLSEELSDHGLSVSALAGYSLEGISEDKGWSGLPEGAMMIVRSPGIDEISSFGYPRGLPRARGRRRSPADGRRGRIQWRRQSKRRQIEHR